MSFIYDEEQLEQSQMRLEPTNSYRTSTPINGAKQHSFMDKLQTFEMLADHNQQGTQLTRFVAYQPDVVKFPERAKMNLKDFEMNSSGNLIKKVETSKA